MRRTCYTQQSITLEPKYYHTKFEEAYSKVKIFSNAFRIGTCYRCFIQNVVWKSNPETVVRDNKNLFRKTNYLASIYMYIDSHFHSLT